MIENNNNTPFHSLVVGRSERNFTVEANLCKCFSEICICLSKCTSEAFLLESINYIHSEYFGCITLSSFYDLWRVGSEAKGRKEERDWHNM